MKEIAVTEEMIEAGLDALEKSWILPESGLGLGAEERWAVIRIFSAMKSAARSELEMQKGRPVNGTVFSGDLECPPDSTDQKASFDSEIAGRVR